MAKGFRMSVACICKLVIVDSSSVHQLFLGYKTFIVIMKFSFIASADSQSYAKHHNAKPMIYFFLLYALTSP